MSIFASVDRRPVYFSKSGLPLSYGRIFYYEVDGITKKTVYTDIAKTVPAANSQLLNIFGRTETPIYLGAGDYTIVSKEYVGTGVGAEAEDSIYWAFDNQWSDSGEGLPIVIGDTLSTVETVSDLKTIAVGGSVILQGYYSAGDKPAIVYTWHPLDVQTDNGGTIIKSTTTGTGSWLYASEGEVDAKIFGCGITTVYTNSQYTAWQNYCYNNGKVGRLTNGVYYFSYGVGDVNLLHDFPLIVDNGVKFSNYSTGRLLVNVTNFKSVIYKQDALQYVSSVGVCAFKFPSWISFDIDPRWYGYVSGGDASAAYQLMLGVVDSTNTIIVEGIAVINTYTAGVTLIPILRFIGDAYIYLTFAGPTNCWNFTDIITSTTTTTGGIAFIDNSSLSFTQSTSDPRTSYFRGGIDIAAALSINGPTWTLDNACVLTSNVTLIALKLGGGVISASANLTVNKILGADYFWNPSTSSNHLIVASQPYNPVWYGLLNYDIAQIFGDSCVTGASAIVDFSDDSYRTRNGAVIWDMNNRSMEIRTLYASDGTMNFTPTNYTLANLKMVDCDIISTTTGVMLPACASVVTENCIIKLTTLYTPLNPINFGKMCLSMAGSIYIKDSYLRASRLFEGTGVSFDSVGSTLIGENLFIATQHINAQSSKLGNAAGIYWINGANSFSSETYSHFTDVVSTSDICIYTVSALGIKDNVFSGCTFQPITTTLPHIRLISQHPNAYINGCNVIGNTFGVDGIGAGVDIVTTEVTGSGSFNTGGSHIINIYDNVCGQYYNNVATRGQWSDDISVTVTGGVAAGIFSPIVQNPKQFVVVGSTNRNWKYSFTSSGCYTGSGTTIQRGIVFMGDPRSATEGVLQYYASCFFPALAPTAYEINIVANWSTYASSLY